MPDANWLTEMLTEVLPVIDEHVSSSPLHRRPLLAAIEFTQTFIMEVKDDSNSISEGVGEYTDFVKRPWFSKIFGWVEDWYRDQYGAALENPIDDHLHGVVLISGAPFAINVPATVMRPDKPGETAWFSWPNKVLDGEVPTRWLVGPPKIEKFEEPARTAVEAIAAEVAGALRRIRSGLMGVPRSDKKMEGLTAGILPSLEQAVRLVLKQDRERLQKSYWELQMACEHALKALQQYKTGKFTETHDLFTLWDRIPEADAAFPRDLLKSIPRSREEMSNLRYSLGDRDDVAEWFDCYRAVLKVVSGAIKPMIKLDLGEASFLIGRPPWTQKTDSGYLHCAKLLPARQRRNFMLASQPQTKLTLRSRNVSITDAFILPSRCLDWARRRCHLG